MTIPTPLRAITIHPWWAYAITHGDKRVEYRTRPLPAKFVGVPVALHAGSASGAFGKYGDSDRVWTARDLGAPIDAWRAAGCPSSAFVGVVVFSGTVPTDLLPMSWRCAGFVGWQICGLSRLSTPWPAAGKQGFWTCTDEQREAIVSGLGALAAMEVTP